MNERWTDKQRGLIGANTYPSRTNALSFNAGQRENLGGLSQAQAFEGSVRIKRFGMYEQIFDSENTNNSTTNCCNVSPGAAYSPMKCGTSQQLSIIDDYIKMGITSACTTTRYKWTLELAPGGWSSGSGIGSLNTAIITNPIYTAPACEQEEGAPELQTTVRISLFCNDVLADYMDINIKTTVCCPKKINYETLRMWCGDDQTLSPNEWSEDCDPGLYSWEIIGAGAFSEYGSGDYTRTFNAPECGSYCGEKTTINLYCDNPERTGEPCDTIDITFYPCPKNAYITYTTQQMHTDESQTLGIDRQDGECAGSGANWLWELSGGGSLSDPTSPTGCIYTAPPDNANCEDTPTIILSCDGVVMDTLSIVVNAYPTNYTAYQQNSQLSLLSSACHRGAWNQNVGDNYWFRTTWYDCEDNAITYREGAFCHILTGAQTAGCSTNAADCDFEAHDQRTEAMREAGCCPAELF